MPTDRSAVAVVGATGFVGRELLPRLRERGFDPVAVVRDLRGASDLAREYEVVSSPVGKKRYATVVNLAHPAGGRALDFADVDAHIAATVADLVEPEGRLIHASTLAVFGFGLQRDVAPVAATQGRDHPYVESKIGMERKMIDLQRQKRLALDVVRLGNVWGRSSATWTLPLIHRLVTGRPVAVDTGELPSNTTDVANTASYLAYLVERDSLPAIDPLRFHHLAEFAAVSWRQWIDSIASELECEPVFVQRSAIPALRTVRGELAYVAEPLSAMELYRRAASQRVVGSWSRSAIRRLPGRVERRLRANGSVYASDRINPEDELFLRVVGTDRRFECVLDPDWRPEIDAEESTARVLNWLRLDDKCI